MAPRPDDRTDSLGLLGVLGSFCTATIVAVLLVGRRRHRPLLASFDVPGSVSQQARLANRMCVSGKGHSVRRFQAEVSESATRIKSSGARPSRIGVGARESSLATELLGSTASISVCTPPIELPRLEPRKQLATEIAMCQAPHTGCRYVRVIDLALRSITSRDAATCRSLR